MKKIIYPCFFVLILLSLSSCSFANKLRFKELLGRYHIKNISCTDLKYSYIGSKGALQDHRSVAYYYVSFDEYPTKFINQFESRIYKFNDGRNEDFEEELMKKIDCYIGEKYNEIEANYRIDFSKDYMYSTLPMIFYKDTFDLIIIDYGGKDVYSAYIH